MCGISFIWQATATPKDLDRSIKRMARAQDHRGPDASHSRVIGNAAIAHNRLRVLDLDPRADQPFGSQDCDALLSFNGEIYNHGELREELVEQGVSFHTHSDTEVLYHSLHLWGVEAIPRLNGMFAFAWFDPVTDTLLLARDRIGIKPLYLAHSRAYTLASSEIKGIFASGLVLPGLSGEAIHQVMRFNHTLGTTTAFEGVQSIPPASYTLIDLKRGTQDKVTYWRPTFSNGGTRTFDERVNDLDRRFRQAVQLQSVADVSLASFMSGGIDSTGLVAEAKQVLGDDHMTYSMIFPGVDYSEESSVDRLVEERGDHNTKVPINGITLEEYAHYILSAEMPQWWTTDLALMLLAEGVHQRGHRVAFSGEGPDEFLAGYEVYRLMKIRSLLQQLGISGLLKNALVQKLIATTFKPWYKVDLSMIAYYLDCHDRSRGAEINLLYGFHPENLATWEILVPVLKGLVMPSFKQSFESYEKREQTFFDEVIKPQMKGRSPLEANLLFEIGQRLPNWILHMSDRVSAANQVELRLPYLENGMVDGMLDLPEHDRLRGFKEKYILKRMHRDRVPQFILKRKKQPLYTPAYAWVRHFAEEKTWPRYWSEATFKEVGFFDFDSCEDLRKRLEMNAQSTELERLASEWSYCFILSIHVLHRAMQDRLGVTLGSASS
jgi:asparagine synthase (glutamine-hydrolysing)